MLMKVGIDSYSYHRFFGEIYPNQIDPGARWEFEQSIDETIRLGADGVSLETCFLPSVDPDYLARLKDKLDKHNLDRMVAWGHPDGLEGGKKPEAAVDLESHLATCKAVGADVMRIVGSSLMFRHESHGPQIERLSAILKESVKRAEDVGVRLAIENHIDFTSDEILEILANVNSPYLGVNFDSGNTLRAFEDPVEAAKKLARYTYATHMKDIDPGHGSPQDWTFWASAPCGFGIIDMPGVVKALTDGGYDGVMCVEIDFLKDPQADETKAVEEAVTYLRALIAES
ncbi:MAG: xylose isomerase [Planctomycetaceae bacterium]|nr:xylose isomerase [Planctomycetaceae bacterium]